MGVFVSHFIIPIVFMPDEKDPQLADSTISSSGSRVWKLKYRIISPVIFSVCMWLIAVYPEKAVQSFYVPDIFIPNNTTNHVKDLAPDSMYESYLLGEIAAKLKDSTSPQDSQPLLERASDILNAKGNLTIQDVTQGVEKAIQMKDERKEHFKKLKGAFSFIGILSIIAVIGIFATLASNSCSPVESLTP